MSVARATIIPCLASGPSRDGTFRSSLFVTHHVAASAHPRGLKGGEVGASQINPPRANVRLPLPLPLPPTCHQQIASSSSWGRWRADTCCASSCWRPRCAGQRTRRETRGVRTARVRIILFIKLVFVFLFARRESRKTNACKCCAANRARDGTLLVK